MLVKQSVQFVIQMDNVPQLPEDELFVRAGDRKTTHHRQGSEESEWATKQERTNCSLSLYSTQSIMCP